MKRVYTLALAVLFIATSGCTFFTEVEADINTGSNDGDSSSCDSLFIMLEAERDPDMRAELAAAYARCIDNNTSPNPCDEGQADTDECRPTPRPCEDGQISEDGQCVSPPAPCDSEDGADCRPGDPETRPIDCSFVEQNADIIDQMTDEELLDACDHAGLEFEVCVDLIRQCLHDGNGGEDGNSDGDNSTAPTCQDAYDAVAQFSADPNGLSEEDAYDLCVQHGSVLGFGELTDRECQQLAQTCFPLDGNSDGSDPDDSQPYCDTIVEMVEDEGYTVPLDDQTAQQLHSECVQNLSDTEQCDVFLQCVI